MTSVLDIFLNERRVGVLTLLPGGRNLFSFDESYADDPKRPVLSQSYFSAEGDLLTPPKAYSGKVPPFFSNLLPEGHLRAYLAERGGIKPTHEFYLLYLLGEDLPGAVIAKPAKGFSLPRKKEEQERSESKEAEQPLRFSLAGVQLKFSALMARNGGLTIPASGMGGNWIVKLPSPAYDNIPENEYAMMHMAAEIGIPVPETKLVPLSDIVGLPDFGKLRGKQALAVKRFDRTEDGKRIHIEDFAQVYSVFPEKKYEGVSFTNIAGMVWTLTGEEGLRDFIRHLAFTILTGNGDMHLKNWSFIYRDGRTPELSPAYDLVSTIPYIPGDKLALKFLNTKDMMLCDLQLFEKLAEKAGLPKKLVLDAAGETAEKTREAWKKNKAHYALPSEIEEVIDGHMSSVVL
ncbi:MAG: type II toxin-antitoxin system HipA family toxin [Nitrospirales bacterium]|nr:type II toxin-antitoxin system HipA family toxin [Alphaproteobacteria bacterium]MDR4502739.1 type II toxin-antitoxin system HipA family toxin [Nitrospirales bacterium]